MTASMIVLGLAGGLIPDVLRIIKLRHKTMPGYLKKPWFYVGLALQMAVGVFVVYLLQPDEAVYALACGFSAPQILTNLMGAAADRMQSDYENKTRQAEKPGLLRFWRT